MADKKTKEESQPPVPKGFIMPKKKEDQVEGQSLEPVITTLKPKEKLLALSVTTHFADGNLGDFFRKYGYEVEWPVGEVRNIPRWLAQRCEQSGATLERADE